MRFTTCSTTIILILLSWKTVPAKTLLATVTAYDNCKLCTGKTPDNKGYGITKSGKIASKGTIAVDPKIIPLGTKLKIEGFRDKVFRAEDTGRATRGNRIEIWMESHRKALRFGRKRLHVFIIRQLKGKHSN